MTRHVETPKTETNRPRIGDLPVAVIGGGPIGLAAAAQLIEIAVAERRAANDGAVGDGAAHTIDGGTGGETACLAIVCDSATARDVAAHTIDAEVGIAVAVGETVGAVSLWEG